MSCVANRWKNPRLDLLDLGYDLLSEMSQTLKDTFAHLLCYVKSRERQIYKLHKNRRQTMNDEEGTWRRGKKRTLWG